MGELEQEPKAIAVRRNGMRAGLALPSESFGEERFKGGGERSHGVRSMDVSSRRAAAPNSSGVADKYQ